jgi:hypothetical protein
MPTPFSNTGHRGKLLGRSHSGSRTFRWPNSVRSETWHKTITPLQQDQQINWRGVNKALVATRNEGTTENTREIVMVGEL